MTATDLAERFDLAQVNVSAIDPPAETATYTPTDAYRAQHELMARRIARGERLVGLKLGFTSKAKMEQMGLTEVIAGQLTDAMHRPDRSVASLARFIAPRIEPEIAFRLSRDVDLGDPAEDLAFAIDAVAPALDIIDSRVRDYKFDQGAVVADNASAGAFIVGSWTPWSPSVVTALPNLAVVLNRDGRQQAVGSTAAILGDPLRILPAVQGLAAQHGLLLLRGDIVLAGAATASVPLAPGYFEARVASLGTVGIEFTEHDDA